MGGQGLPNHGHPARGGSPVWLLPQQGTAELLRHIIRPLIRTRILGSWHKQVHSYGVSLVNPVRVVQFIDKSAILSRYPGDSNNRISQKFSSPTYTVDGVRAGSSTQDCRKAHNDYKDAISQAGNEAGSCDGGKLNYSVFLGLLQVRCFQI